MIFEDLVSKPAGRARAHEASKRTVSRFWLLVGGLALTKLALHFFTNTNYGLHRDEYLYLALADHLDFGYASVPPLIGLISWFTQTVFGDSGFAVRLFPALIGALSVMLIGWIVREMAQSGKMALSANRAVLLAGTAFVLSPAFLRSNTMLMPVSFNQFFWLLSACIMVRMLARGNPKYWSWLGVVWGLGFLNKYSIAFLALAFVAALIFAGEWRLLRPDRLWQGAVLGGLIILPNLLWQWAYNWPVIHHLATLQQSQLVHVRIGDFLLMQVLMNIHALPLWLFGAFFLIFSAPGKRWRALGYMFLIIIALLILLRGKHYYTLGIYPLLFAAGGVGIAHHFHTRWTRLQPAILGLMVLIALPVLPYSLPLLSYPKMAAYAQATRSFGLAGALVWEDGKIHPLPQDYADMTGWNALGDLVVNAYHRLSPDEQAHCAIYGENYGHAGAIKYYGKKQFLPEPVSFSDAFLQWAPDSLTFEVLIYVNHRPGEDILRGFRSVEKVGQITDDFFRENGLGVYICREPDPTFFDFYRRKVADLKSRFRARQMVPHPLSKAHFPGDLLRSVDVLENELQKLYIDIKSSASFLWEP